MHRKQQKRPRFQDGKPRLEEREHEIAIVWSWKAIGEDPASGMLGNMPWYVAVCAAYKVHVKATERDSYTTQMEGRSIGKKYLDVASIILCHCRLGSTQRPLSELYFCVDYSE